MEQFSGRITRPERNTHRNFLSKSLDLKLTYRTRSVPFADYEELCKQKLDVMKELAILKEENKILREQLTKIEQEYYDRDSVENMARKRSMDQFAMGYESQRVSDSSRRLSELEKESHELDVEMERVKVRFSPESENSIRTSVAIQKHQIHCLLEKMETYSKAHEEENATKEKDLEETKEIWRKNIEQIVEKRKELKNLQEEQKVELTEMNRLISISKTTQSKFEEERNLEKRLFTIRHKKESTQQEVEILEEKLEAQKTILENVKAEEKRAKQSAKTTMRSVGTARCSRPWLNLSMRTSNSARTTTSRKRETNSEAEYISKEMKNNAQKKEPEPELEKEREELTEIKLTSDQEAAFEQQIESSSQEGKYSNENLTMESSSFLDSSPQENQA